MRAVAEFVMRGRPQAIAVSFGCAVLPFLQWLAISSVALVVLRRGLGEGMLVLMWAALPMLVMLYMVGDVTSLVWLLGTGLMAYLLRTTSSWELVMGAAVVVSAIGTLLFEYTAAGLMNGFVEFYLSVLKDAQSEPGGPQIVLPAVSEVYDALFGVLAFGNALSMLGLLILARWWQAMLYNPGGFGEEFHSLRISPGFASFLVLLALASFGLGEGARWGYLTIVPLAIAGLGLVHWLIAKRNLSRGWLVSFYLMIILLQLLPLVALFALADSWFDFRNRSSTE